MVDEYGWTGNSRNSAANVESYGYDADKPAAREAMDKEMLAFHEEWGALQEKVRYYRDGNDAMGFQLTYGEARLDVLLTIPPMDDKSVYVYGYPDIRIGIRQIYEMIPEFS